MNNVRDKLYQYLVDNNLSTNLDNKNLADILSCSERSIRRSIKDLMDNGTIIIENIDNIRHIRKVGVAQNEPDVAQNEPDVAQNEPGVDQNPFAPEEWLQRKKSEILITDTIDEFPMNEEIIQILNEYLSNGLIMALAIEKAKIDYYGDEYKPKKFYHQLIQYHTIKGNYHILDKLTLPIDIVDTNKSHLIFGE